MYCRILKTIISNLNYNCKSIGLQSSGVTWAQWRYTDRYPCWLHSEPMETSRWFSRQPPVQVCVTVQLGGDRGYVTKSRTSQPGNRHKKSPGHNCPQLFEQEHLFERGHTTLLSELRLTTGSQGSGLCMTRDITVPKSKSHSQCPKTKVRSIMCPHAPAPSHQTCNKVSGSWLSWWLWTSMQSLGLPP